MPVAMISTRTSPSFGPSRSTSTISSGFLASNATAARVFMSRFPLSLRRLCPQEAPYPTGNARIVVGQVERGDLLVRLGHDVVPLLDQRLGELRREFRVELKGDGGPVGPCEPRERRECGLEDDLGVRWLDDHLILMRRRC